MILRTLERVESAEEKNLVFWGGSCLKKFSQQNVEKLFSWGWMVDKLVRSINFEKNGELHKKEGLLTCLKFSASNFWPRWSLKWRELKSYLAIDAFYRTHFPTFKLFLMFLYLDFNCKMPVIKLFIKNNFAGDPRGLILCR